MSDIYTRHLYLDAAAKAALVAHHVPNVSRIDAVRDSLVAALSGCRAGDTGVAEALLLDTINTAITDSLDVDWKTEDAARLVLERILDEVAPLPKAESEAA